MAVGYALPRGTRAALTALAAANGLRAGQAYLLTDEARIAVATSVSAFTTFAKENEADGWSRSALAADFVTSSATAVDSGLAFTPAANQRYEFEVLLLTRTATATVGPRPGIAWPSGAGSDGAAEIVQPSSATAALLAYGNNAAAMLAAVGGLPTTTGSFLAAIKGVLVAGTAPSGSLKVQLASETAGTNVTFKAGSLLKWRAF